MTKRYAHLGPDHLHNEVANLGFSAHWNPGQAVGARNGGKALVMQIDKPNSMAGLKHYSYWQKRVMWWQ